MVCHTLIVEGIYICNVIKTMSILFINAILSLNTRGTHFQAFGLKHYFLQFFWFIIIIKRVEIKKANFKHPRITTKISLPKTT